ncbi:MAG: thioredoxin family protein [Desulfobacterales bacterium]
MFKQRKGKGIMGGKVLGPGCPKCKQTEAIVRETVAESGVDAVVEKVTGVMDIAGRFMACSLGRGR